MRTARVVAEFLFVVMAIWLVVAGHQAFASSPWTWLSDSSGDNGVIANDTVLDFGNYLKNTSPAADGEMYERSFTKATIASNQRVEYTAVVRRQAGNTSPELYLFSGNVQNTMRYDFSSQDASWGGGYWYMQALNLDTYPAANSSRTNCIRIEGAANIVDMKTVVTASDVSFYWRNHGSVAWNLVESMSGWGTDSVEKVQIALYSEGAPTDGIDSVKVERIGTGTLVGQVTLQNYTGSAAAAATIDFIKGGSVVRTENVILDQNGGYSVGNIDEGAYDLRFKAATWLSKRVSGQEITSGGTTTCNVTLLSGDVDGNNQVTNTDIGILLSNLGLTGQ